MGVRGLLEPTIERGRARYHREGLDFRGPATKVAAVRDFTIDAIRVRHYAPFASAPAPLTVYLHGGGFAIGDLDSHDEPCRILCHHGGVHVLAIDYRLAPEHPFPAALGDALQALAWAQENASSLGADEHRVGIGGDSAGGNLATVASRIAPLTPCAQLLVYPAVDATRLRRSHELFGTGLFLTNADREGFGACYGGNRNDPCVSPIVAADLAKLPPALVITAGFDILRDEGEAYAEALRAAGAITRAKRYASLPHGFLHLTGVAPAAREAAIEIARTWRSVLDSIAR
jgi:acetyl esterase